MPLGEIQDVDMDKIVRGKAADAYAKLGHPVLVDHSGLAMRALGGLPRGLNKQFWEILEGKVCKLAYRLHDPRAVIMAYLGICDGYKVHTIHQEDPGRIAPKPAKMGRFHLDKVFIPQDCHITLAEMRVEERDRIGYRRKAAEKAITKLRTLPLGKSLRSH